MKHYAISEIVKGTGGRLIASGSEEYVSGIKIDSRVCEPGDLFVCIIGPNNDGHKYIDQVIGAGVKTILISRPEAAEGRSAEGRSDCNFILADDTVKAMQQLATYYLKQNDIKIIGVTGSVGKTSTSDMVKAACSVRYKTGKTLKNYNNDIGMPVSILSFDEDTDVGVLEMGMDHAGEISLLVDIARPEVGVITNIGVSHIENLGSRENIFKAKMEITDKFDENCALVINGDDDFLCCLKSRLKTPSQPQQEKDYDIISAGTGNDDDYRISEITDRGEYGVDFTLEHGGSTYQLHLPVPGKHNALNAALAIAAAGRLGIPADEAAEGLAEFALTDKRLDIKTAGDIKVIDDTYNASPASMKAALDVLMAMEGKRKAAILGDMFELGKNSDDFHREVGAYAGNCGADLLIAIGESGKFYAEAAADIMDKDRVIYFKNKEDLFQKLDDIIKEGDVILVKGSNGMKMDTIVERILEKKPFEK